MYKFGYYESLYENIGLSLQYQRTLIKTVSKVTS